MGKKLGHPRAAPNGHLPKYEEAQGSGNLRTISVSSAKVRSNRVPPVMLLFTLGASTRASSGIGRKKAGNLQSEQAQQGMGDG
ncbi:unnamed protein product [Ectocarpus sp. 12 AP-2014]